MEYITLSVPPFPFFIYAGDALYRSGDFHRRRSRLGCFDLIFVEKGTLFLTDGNQRYVLGKNEMLIVHPNRTHYGHKPCQMATYFHWLHFDTTETYLYSETGPGKMEGEQRSFDNPRIEVSTLILPSHQHFNDKEAKELLSLLKNLESLSIDRNRQGAMFEKKYMDQNSIADQILFMELLLKLSIQDSRKTASSFAAAAMRYMQEHYREEISLPLLARKVNCHPSHLIRCFRKEYNMTPIEMLNQLRMQQAKTLLYTSSMSCGEIAEQVGYSSVSYFSNRFRKMFGISPRTFRENG